MPVLLDVIPLLLIEPVRITHVQLIQWVLKVIVVNTYLFFTLTIQDPIFIVKLDWYKLSLRVAPLLSKKMLTAIVGLYFYFVGKCTCCAGTCTYKLISLNQPNFYHQKRLRPQFHIPHHFTTRKGKIILEQPTNTCNAWLIMKILLSIAVLIKVLIQIKIHHHPFLSLPSSYRRVLPLLLMIAMISEVNFLNRTVLLLLVVVIGIQSISHHLQQHNQYQNFYLAFSQTNLMLPLSWWLL